MAARLALAQSKLVEADMPAEIDDLAVELSGAIEATEEIALEAETTQTINVEELEFAPVDMQDIEADGVKLSDDDDALEVSDEDA